MSDLVGNPEERFSQNEAQLIHASIERNKYCFPTDRHMQIVYTQIRLLLQEQSDLGIYLEVSDLLLHFLLFMQLFFVFLLLNIPVNIYGHVGTVSSDFVRLLPDIEMNETPSPANKIVSYTIPVNSLGLKAGTV